jgi:hypothetical protein
MSRFANQEAFDQPASRFTAAGFNLSPSHAIVDLQGSVLAHAQGILEVGDAVLRSRRIAGLPGP